MSSSAFARATSWLLFVGAKRGVVAEGVRRHRRLRGDRVAAPDEADLALDVVGQADRAPQRDLLRRVAADHRVFHVEVRQRRVAVDVALQRDRPAAPGSARCLPVRRGDGRELRRHAGEVGLAVQEAQPARLVLLDDGDLDAVVERQALAVAAASPRPALRRRRRRARCRSGRRGSSGCARARCASCAATT